MFYEREMKFQSNKLVHIHSGDREQSKAISVSVVGCSFVWELLAEPLKYNSHVRDVCFSQIPRQMLADYNLIANLEDPFSTLILEFH